MAHGPPTNEVKPPPSLSKSVSFMFLLCYLFVLSVFAFIPRLLASFTCGLFLTVVGVLALVVVAAVVVVVVVAGG